MRRAAALAVLLLLPARAASAEVLDGWPCPGCITVTPAEPASADAGSPAVLGARPLVVALHGDGGGVRPLVRAWKAAAAAAGVVLLAPRCPRELGCTAQSFWKWYDSSGHDPAWLGAQIDAVSARFPIDPRRVYATGYSGGATYLGWYAPTHDTRFAAVAHVAGGAAYRPPCPACKVPVLFVLGAGDPMLHPYTRPLHDWYEGCGGHEIVWETLPGVTHEGILQVLEAGRAGKILSWLLGHAATCADPRALDGGGDGVAMSDAGADAAPPPRLEPSPPAVSSAGASTAAPPPPRVPPAVGGCACDQGAASPPLSGILAALGVLVARRRRRHVTKLVTMNNRKRLLDLLSNRDRQS